MKLDESEILSAYDELQRLAALLLSRERDAHSLQTIDLVNEAYIRLHNARDTFADRAHFLAVAARAMRRVLIDQARSRRALKREGADALVDWDDARVHLEADLDGYVAIDRALRRLDRDHPALAEVIELRFFGGLSVAETGQALGVSTRTVKRRWNDACALLRPELARRK